MESDYVTVEGWTQQPGRPGHIDEVADAFERPAAATAEDFWSGTQAGWPTHRQRGLTTRYVERRAG